MVPLRLRESRRLFQHMWDFSRGIVDTRPIILLLSMAFFFLFVTLRFVESRRWK